MQMLQMACLGNSLLVNVRCVHDESLSNFYFDVARRSLILMAWLKIGHVIRRLLTRCGFHSRFE